MMRMAEALAFSAIFAFFVKLQFPRRTKITSPVSYKHTEQFDFKSMELWSINIRKPYLILRHTTTIRRICQSNSSMSSMFFLWFQGRAKSSTNTNIFNGRCTINPSRDFHLNRKINELQYVCRINWLQSSKLSLFEQAIDSTTNIHPLNLTHVPVQQA